MELLCFHVTVVPAACLPHLLKGTIDPSCHCGTVLGMPRPAGVSDVDSSCAICLPGLWEQGLSSPVEGLLWS